MRPGLLPVLAAALALLAACGSGGSRDAAQDEKETAQRQKNCADPAWKEAHLGVWYAVCRPNAAVR
jgi:outer membrane biogenesis lipoprotein LolB